MTCGIRVPHQCTDVGYWDEAPSYGRHLIAHLHACSWPLASGGSRRMSKVERSQIEPGEAACATWPRCLQTRQSGSRADQAGAMVRGRLLYIRGHVVLSSHGFRLTRTRLISPAPRLGRLLRSDTLPSTAYFANSKADDVMRHQLRWPRYAAFHLPRICSKLPSLVSILQTAPIESSACN